MIFVLNERETAHWNESKAMQTARTQISDELIYHYKDSGYLVKIVDSAIDNAINVFVKPELEAATISSQYIVSVLSWKTCSWYNSWWARFIRRMIDSTNPQLKRLARCIIPDAVAWLCYAIHPMWRLENRNLPNDVLERITAQRYEMVKRDMKPSMVLIGREAMYEIMTHSSMADRNLWRDGMHRYDGKQHILGLELKESPWLSKDSIVVV